MRNFFRQAALPLAFGAVTLISACTDGRPSTFAEISAQTLSSSASTKLTARGDIRYKVNGQAQATYADQITMHGGSLFMTGRPMGFSRLEIAQDMENPSITFTMRSQIDTFSPIGNWIQEYYASGALAIYNQVAFMSGSKGLSVVSMSQTATPVEVQRYPSANTSGPIQADGAYIYSAMVVHPSRPILYGFTRQDFLYTWDLAQGTLKSMAKDAYGSNPGQAVCCAMGAAVYGNQVYVGFRDRLVIYSIGANGLLQKIGSTLALNATNVVSTSRYLYVQHEPTNTSVSGGVASAQGIYVFDSNGQNVAYFAAGSPRTFAVSPDDAYLYANVDGQSVKIFKINW